MKSNSTIKHFLIISAGTFLNLIIGLLTTPVITRLVDPTEYGQLSIFNLYASIAVMVFCIGLDQALVRYYYKHDNIEYRSGLAKKCIVWPVVLWTIFAIIFYLLTELSVIQFEFTNDVLVVLILCVYVQLIDRITVLITRLEYHSGKYSIINIATKTSYALAAIIAVKLIDDRYLFILACCTLFSYLVSSTLSIFFERKVWFSKNAECDINLKELVKYGSPFVLSLGITTVFQGIDKMSLNHFCDYAEVGIYSSAMSLVHIFAIIQTSFNAIWAPMATEHYEKQKEDREFYIKGNAYITIIMFFAGLSLILCKDIFAILLGEKYREAAYILPCLIFNPIMYTISETTVSGINFSKKSHLHIWVAAISCIVNIIGNTLLVPIYGGRGAAISTGVSYIVFFTLRTVFANKYFPIDFKLLRFYALTTLALVYALLNTFIHFGLVSIIGYVMCIITLFFLYRSEVIECFCIARTQAKKIINKRRQ